MEINAKVYAVAKSRELLGQVHEALRGKAYTTAGGSAGSGILTNEVTEAVL